MIQVSEGNTWNKFLAEETSKPYFARLERWIREEERKRVIYPSKELRFRAFEETPFDKVKVIIAMSEPYESPNTADGLALSSLYNMTPELSNFFRKIEDELGIQCNKEDTDLTRWTRQGVFLLNMSLTTWAGRRGQHRNHDWCRLTYGALKELYNDNKPKVFILLGDSVKLCSVIEKNNNHLILLGHNPDTSHFFFRNYFKETQDFLIKNNRGPIDWT